YTTQYLRALLLRLSRANHYSASQMGNNRRCDPTIPHSVRGLSAPIHHGARQRRIHLASHSRSNQPFRANAPAAKASLIAVQYLAIHVILTLADKLAYSRRTQFAL